MTMAAAAGQLKPDHVASRNGLASLRPDRPPRAQRNPAGCAGLAAASPACGVKNALEIAQKADRHSVNASDLDHLPEPAAKSAGAA